MSRVSHDSGFAAALSTISFGDFLRAGQFAGSDAQRLSEGTHGPR
jgi:hypothetical protein